MRAGIALWWAAALAAGGCAELGNPAGTPAAVDAGAGEADAGSSDEPGLDAAPVDQAIASCADELARAPGAADGVYSIDRGDGPEDVYCDMGNGGVSYAELAFGNSFATYDGYSGATGADLADPAVQQAFIYLYNRQGGGATNIDVGYNSANCCFRGAGAAATTVLTLGGSILFPADVGADTMNCNGTYSAAAYRFVFPAGDGVYPPATLPADYFATNAPGEVVNCSDDNNPGFFFERF